MSRYEDPEGTGESGQLSPVAAGRPNPWAQPARGGPRPARGGRWASGRAGIRRILGRHPVLSILGILATLTITFVSLSAYAAYRGVYDSIHHVTITSGELGKRPPKLNGSENILIIGSDSRTGIARQVRPRHPGIPLGHVDAAAHLAHPYRRDRDQFPAGHHGADLPVRPPTAKGTTASRRSRAGWSSSTRPSPTAARPACGRPWSRSPAFTSTTSSRSTSRASSRSSTTSAASRCACPTPSATPRPS